MARIKRGNASNNLYREKWEIWIGKEKKIIKQIG